MKNIADRIHIQTRFDEFMDNHWPTMERRVGRIEGAVWFMALSMTGVMGFLGVLVALVAKTS
jgi:hypothetical protein